MHTIIKIYDYNHGHWDNGKRPTWPYLDQSPKLCHHEEEKYILQYFTKYIYKGNFAKVYNLESTLGDNDKKHIKWGLCPYRPV